MDWDLRDAELAGAKIQWVTISKARLEGTHLEQIVMGYTTIDGSIDAYTRLPSAICKKMEPQLVHCSL